MVAHATSITAFIINRIFYVVHEGCTWRALPHDLPPWQTVYTEILHHFQACCRGGFHLKPTYSTAKRCKPALTYRAIHRLGRVYKNCLLVATLKGKPAPTNLYRQFNENGARCQYNYFRYWQKLGIGRNLSLPSIQLLRNLKLIRTILSS